MVPLQRQVRAVRGATTVAADDPAALVSATRELLESLAVQNDIRPADIVSAIFTVTPDLTSEYPARAARELGWTEVPLLCATEIPVPGGVAQCVRVLVTFETLRGRDALRHVYLREARGLRPDLADAGDYLA